VIVEPDNRRLQDLNEVAGPQVLSELSSQTTAALSDLTLERGG